MTAVVVPFVCNDNVVALFNIGAVTEENETALPVETTVPLTLGKVNTVLPATAGADRVTEPEVSPATTILDNFTLLCHTPITSTTFSNRHVRFFILAVVCPHIKYLPLRLML